MRLARCRLNRELKNVKSVYVEMTVRCKEVHFARKPGLAHLNHTIYSYQDSIICSSEYQQKPTFFVDWIYQDVHPRCIG